MATSSVERLRQLEQAVEADRQLQEMETRLALIVQRVASCHPPSPPSSPLPFGLRYADIALGVNMGLLAWLVMVRFFGYTLPVSPTKSEMEVRSPPPATVTVPTSHPELHTPYPLEQLFATKRSPGSIAVSVAEGRLSADGLHEDQSDEDDPGNHALNRGFCNWNHADGLTYAEADAHCLAALQHQAAATIHNLQSVGIEPTVELVVNGTDLWNQSNQAGEAFAQHFKEVFEEVRSIDEDSLTAARVEAFRNSANQLDASGLFSICSRYPYYQTRLQAYASYPESWKWECIALDQRRRVQAVGKVLRLHVGSKTSAASSARGVLKAKSVHSIAN